jgi:hypothetical protein
MKHTRNNCLQNDEDEGDDDESVADFETNKMRNHLLMLLTVTLAEKMRTIASMSCLSQNSQLS